MNVVTLTGNATDHAQLSYTPNGVGIAKGVIAVRRDFKNKDGEYETDFINWKSIGKVSEVIANHIQKGDKWGLTGRLQVSKYEKDGQTRYFTEVIVNSFDFPNKPRNNAPQNNQQSQPQNNDPFAGSSQEVPFDENSLPF